MKKVIYVGSDEELGTALRCHKHLLHTRTRIPVYAMYARGVRPSTLWDLLKASGILVIVGTRHISYCSNISITGSNQ